MGGEFMFGLNDFWIGLAFGLCLISTIGCIVYGFINWNKGGENEDTSNDDKWEETEEEIEEKL